MDQDLGTAYHPRFLEYLKMIQQKDLSVAGALTEPRGKRSQNRFQLFPVLVYPVKGANGEIISAH